MKPKSEMMAALAKERKSAGLVKVSASAWVCADDADDARADLKQSVKRYKEKAAKVLDK